MTTHPCYTCGDPIEAASQKFVAKFDGGMRDVCEPCAFGIHCGTKTLALHGVTGDFSGSRENLQPPPPQP
jgi:hypothetical protein